MELLAAGSMLQRARGHAAVIHALRKHLSRNEIIYLENVFAASFQVSFSTTTRFLLLVALEANNRKLETNR